MGAIAATYSRDYSPYRGVAMASIYYVLGIICLAALGTSFVGVVLPLRIFGRRRLVALAAVPIIFLLAEVGLKQIEPPEVAARRRSNTQLAGPQLPAWDAALIVRPRFSNAYGAISMRGTFENSSTQAYTEIGLDCAATGENGWVIQHMKVTLHSVVQANGKTRFGPIQLGFLDGQAKHIDCMIMSAQPYGADSAIRVAR